MPKTTSNARDGKSTWASRVGFGLLAALLSGVVLTYLVFFFGLVKGEEFAPDTFRRREFSLLELPLVGLQITPISHADSTGDLEKFLLKDKLVPAVSGEPGRWDLVRVLKGSAGGSHGDARILCRYLDAQDPDGDLSWLKWSEENTELAKVVWPSIASLARQGLYSFVPDVFLLARSATQPEPLRAALDQALAEKYLWAAENFQALERDEAAVELFSECLVHDPDCQAALLGRAKTFARLGDELKAAADTARADELGSQR